MKRILVCIFLAAVFCSAAFGQQKPWSQWDKKEVEKMLNSSAWGQTQTETDTSQMTYTPTTDKSAMTTDGARNQAVDLKYRIRLFSAKPIREAFARMVLMSNPNLKAEQLNGFVNGDYSESIVVAVTFESSDRRYSGPVGQKFSAATTETLKNLAYLENSEGKKVFIDEYARPSTDGTGAKFVFPRLIDGKPWVKNNDTLRFFADFEGGTKVNWRFKLSDMMYNGALEY